MGKALAVELSSIPGTHTKSSSDFNTHVMVWAAPSVTSSGSCGRKNQICEAVETCSGTCLGLHSTPRESRDQREKGREVLTLHSQRLPFCSPSSWHQGGEPTVQ